MIFLSLSCTCLDPFKAVGRCKCFDHRGPSYHQGPSGYSTTCQLQGGRKPQGQGQACGISVLERQKQGLLQGRCQGPALRAVPGSRLPWWGMTATQRTSAAHPIRQSRAAPIQGSTTPSPGARALSGSAKAPLGDLHLAADNPAGSLSQRPLAYPE